MIRSLFIVFIVPLLGAAIVAAACASNERLTVSEYAEFCADGIASARTLIEPESVTWGDLVRLGAPSLQRLRAEEPPDELAEFHRASIKTLDFVVGVAEEQPAEELANPLAFGLNAVRIATQLSRAIDALDPSIRATMRRAGCL
ncbi:MAG: hypothetical protein OXH19_04090 [Chloroflexi bacterium]|nr:hypothetical protein [Chloroflexota bacterium]MCY3588455.1 hypothetical protein [Chloroflexota bacterium]MCY3686828.1 hypothetical protein [Chloroflexota bacterium]MDE2709380.1 hypothetical protein [Chloroflexota bacterium]